MRLVVPAVLLGVTLAGAAAADEHAPLRAAEQELKIARDHLRGAGHDYAGHRRAAIEHVDEALQEVRQALRVTKGGAPASPKRRGETTDSEDDD